MKQIKATAPGKLMLIGEHAVVYGRPCLVTAVDRRLAVAIDETQSGKVEIKAPQVNNTQFVEKALELGVKTWEIKHQGLLVTTESPFSGKYGLGSSAAVVVATLKALAGLFQKKVENRELFKLAYQVILEVQSIGSGFDAAAAIFGGTLYFVTGGRVMEKVESKGSVLPLVVGYTGIKSNSVELVKQVARKRQQYPEKVERILQAIGKLVDQGQAAYIAGDWEKLGKLMDFDQEYLRDLGVSSSKLEDLISAAKRAGAWGAKLSGAGGGDCMIALAAPEKRPAVEGAIASAGGEVVSLQPEAFGVMTETTDDQQEIFIVVDKDDRILGYKTRSECHHDRSLIHRTVGVLIFDSKGRLLLQKRSFTKDTDPGKWAISCAGHVEQGQTSEEAIHRELKEELRVDLPVEFVKKFITSDNNETEMSYLYKTISSGPFVPDPREIEQVAFFDLRSLPLKIASRELVLSSSAEQTLREAGILS